LILGGGGVKPDDVRFWQEDPILADKAEKVIKVFDELKQYLEDTKFKIDDLL